MDNQFKDNVKNSVYQLVCNRNLKLLRILDKVNLENLDLTEKVKELNNSLDNLDLELNNLETNFKHINKPLINADCNISVVSFLTLLFISLFNNLLGLLNKINEFKRTLKGIN